MKENTQNIEEEIYQVALEHMLEDRYIERENAKRIAKGRLLEEEVDNIY